MEVATSSTKAKRSLKLSWAIYGGHISGRRQHGVKMNPIYQEHDHDFSERQPTSKTSGIQFKFYDSLPGHHVTKASSSAPDILYACSSEIPRNSYVCNSFMSRLGDVTHTDTNWHLSDVSLPIGSSAGCLHEEDRDIQTERDRRESVGNTAHVLPWSWPHSGREYRKHLMRQRGIEVTHDDTKCAQNIASLPPMSTSPSRRSSSNSIFNSQLIQKKRRRVCQILKQTSFFNKRKLSVLREQSASIENEHGDTSGKKCNGISVNEHDDMSGKKCNGISVNEQGVNTEYDSCSVSDNKSERYSAAVGSDSLTHRSQGKDVSEIDNAFSFINVSEPHGSEDIKPLATSLRIKVGYFGKKNISNDFPCAGDRRYL